MMTSARYSIGELADLAGVSRRAVRFYVQRGLLPPPEGAGRGHYYTAGHLERLQRLKTLQEAGHSLDEIARLLGTDTFDAHSSRCKAHPVRLFPEPVKTLDEEGPAPAPRALLPGLYLKLPVAEGCELHLDRGRFRLTQAVMRRLQSSIREILDTLPAEDPDDENPPED